jgi:hypothetical protein
MNETFGPASPGKSVLPEWKALERVAEEARKLIDCSTKQVDSRYATELPLAFESLAHAVRDYEVMKHDAAKR